MDERTIQYALLGGLGALVVRALWHHSLWANIPPIPRVPTPAPTTTYHKAALLPGRSGTLQTLKIMRAISDRDSRDPYVRRAAEIIVNHCGGHQTVCEAQRIHEFCRDRITYRRDPRGQERVQDTARTLRHRTGDCDDKVVALCALLGALGIESRMVVCGVSGKRWTHVYAMANCGPVGWVPLDPTPEQAEFGWQSNAPRRAVW